MPRVKKAHLIIRSTKDDEAWIAEAQDGSGVTAQHYLSGTAILVATERLREHWGGEVEVTYEFELPASLQAKVADLLETEEHLQELTRILPAKRMDVAACLAKRHIRQQDMATIMHLSQGYLASIIKRGVDDGYTKIRARRRAGT